MDILDENIGDGKSGMDSATVSGVGVLDRSVAILARLAESPATLAEVVGDTGLPRPTAHRLLSALEKHHLVGRRSGGRYALGSRLVGWGNVAGGRVLPALARTVLGRLRDKVDESAQLYVREGESRVCVAAEERRTGLKTTVAVGAVLPLDLGSAGKVLRELPAAAKRGWAQSVAEREEGVASVSAPVFDLDGVLVAAVSVSGPVSRLGENPGEHLSEAVVGAARQLERLLKSGV